MPVRYDGISLPAARIDADGFLYDSPVLTRTGVFTYRNPDGSTRREYRPPEEVFRTDSLASYKGKPITVRHPAEGEVSPDNARRVSIGVILSAGRQDGDKVLSDIVIHDPAALGINRQLSLGYRLDVEATPGVTAAGEPYDYIQRNIQVNHLSVVPSARAGREARLNLDGDEIIENESEVTKPMAKIRHDGIEYEAAPEIINALEKAQKRADEVEGSVKEIQKKLDTVTAEKDTLQAKVTDSAAAMEKVRKDAADQLDAAVKSRVSLLQVAGDFRIDKADELADKDIKVAVIKAVRGDSFDLTGKSDEYIEAAYDLAKSEKRLDAMGEQRRQVYGDPANPSRQDQEDNLTAEQRRQRMIRNMENGNKGEGK